MTTSTDGTAVLPLGAIVARIKEELQKIEDSPDDGLSFRTSSVTVDLAMATTREAGGKVTVGVPVWKISGIGGEGGLKDARSSRLTVKLEPPQARVAQSMTEDALAGFDLAATVIEARRQLADGLARPPLLQPSELAMEIVFGVERSVSGKAGINILAFEIGATAGLKDASTNKIAVKFTRGAPL